MVIKEVTDMDDLVIITEKGMIIRQHVQDIRVIGRNTQGVRLINLKDADTIADVARVLKDEELDDVENNGIITNAE